MMPRLAATVAAVVAVFIIGQALGWFGAPAPVVVVVVLLLSWRLAAIIDRALP